MLANHAIAWMLTYLLHSTLLLGLAWLVSKPLSRWSVAAEESVWKLALVGALFTASLQFAAAGWEPLAGRWGLASGPAEPAVSASVLVSEERNAALPAPSFRTEIPRVKIADAPAPASAPAFRIPSVPSLALGVWALGAAFLLAGYGASFLRLRRRLRPRPRVIGGTLFSQLRTMALEAGFVDEIRLSCSSRVPVPLALGLRRGEICVPPRALAGLTAEQQEGMLAHELAHLARRDPFWLTVSNLVSSILFFQPLNWVARRRMREISEMLSDEWAVSRTGRPLSLAGCLAEVAGWSVAPRPLPVPSMADRPSHLAQRIRRLLDDTRSPEKPARRWLLGTAMVALVIAVAAAAPAISASRPDSPEPEGVAALAALDAAAAPEPPAAEKRAPRTEVLPREDSEDDDDGFDPFDEEKFSKFEEDFERQLEKELSKLDKEFEVEFEYPYEHDEEFEFELDQDFDVDVDSIVARAMASADAAMLGMRQGDARYEGRELTGEEREKLAREIERATREAQRISERVQREMAPQMERLAREMSEKLNDSHSAEMEKLAAEMSKLGERMRPSPEEMARLHAQARKYREDGVLSREERERIGREAREMAERMRPSEEDRQRMRELREKMMKERAEMRSKFMAEHRGEIERSQREMRDEIERHMQGVREEIRRSMEQRRHELRENRDDRERERRREQIEDRQRERERRREQIEERQRERERRQELQRERLERDRDREDGDKDSSGPSL